MKKITMKIGNTFAETFDLGWEYIGLGWDF